MTVSAQSDDPDWKIAPTGLNVAAGDAAGEIEITWDASSQTTKTLSDYRVTWTPNGEPFKNNDQTDWYAYPTTNQVTVTGLDAGATYKVRVRAPDTTTTKSLALEPSTKRRSYSYSCRTSRLRTRPHASAAGAERQGRRGRNRNAPSQPPSSADKPARYQQNRQFHHLCVERPNRQ